MHYILTTIDLELSTIELLIILVDLDTSLNILIDLCNYLTLCIFIVA